MGLMLSSLWLVSVFPSAVDGLEGEGSRREGSVHLGGGRQENSQSIS